MNSSLLQRFKLPIAIGVLLVLIYFPLFLHLDVVPLRMWDESFYAVSALEMTFNHNFFVKTFNSVPDFYNLKPLLITWIHSLFFSSLGINELSLRLPSALSGLILILVLFFFLKKNGCNVYFSLICCLILVTSKGFVSDHVTRTGDLDAPLSLFLFLSAISFYKYLTNSEKQSKYLNLTIFFTFLAFMTKGVAGLLFLPAYFFLLMYSGKLLSFLRQPVNYLKILLFISAIVFYYLLIEYKQPGYISHVLENEVFGRYLSVKDGHQHGAFYYIGLLISNQFFPWIFLLPFSLIPVIKQIRGKKTDIFVFSLFIIVTYLIVISLGKSKLEWYTAPAFPFLTIIAVKPLMDFFNFFAKYKWDSSLFFKIIFSFAILIYPYYQIIDSVYFPKNDWAAQKYGTFFRQIRKNHPEINKIKVIHDGWNSHLVFYVKLYNEKYGYQIHYENTFEKPEVLKNEIDGVKSGEYVVAFQTEILDPLYHKFNAAILDRYQELVLVRMFSVKNHPATTHQP